MPNSTLLLLGVCRMMALACRFAHTGAPECVTTAWHAQSVALSLVLGGELFIVGRRTLHISQPKVQSAGFRISPHPPTPSLHVGCHLEAPAMGVPLRCFAEGCNRPEPESRSEPYLFAFLRGAFTSFGNFWHRTSLDHCASGQRAGSLCDRVKLERLKARQGCSTPPASPRPGKSLSGG